jgi:hypothetical protein
LLRGAGGSVRVTVQVAVASQAARKASGAGWSRPTSSGTTGSTSSAQPSTRPVALQAWQGCQTATQPASPDPSQYGQALAVPRRTACWAARALA